MRSLGSGAGYPDALCWRSSVGQSSRLVSGRSWVRVPSPAPSCASLSRIEFSRTVRVRRSASGAARADSGQFRIWGVQDFWVMGSSPIASSIFTVPASVPSICGRFGRKKAGVFTRRGVCDRVWRCHAETTFSLTSPEINVVCSRSHRPSVAVFLRAQFGAEPVGACTNFCIQVSTGSQGPRTVGTARSWRR